MHIATTAAPRAGDRVFGGLVGNHGGIRSAALLAFDLHRDAFVATATAIGLFVDAARLPLYLVVHGRELLRLAALIALAIAGVDPAVTAGIFVPDLTPW